MNGNGYLSLAELERGIRDELKLPKVFNSKQAVLRAFQVWDLYYLMHQITDEKIAITSLLLY